MHPDLRWMTHRGDVLDRDTYLAGNTDGSLVWHQQRLEEPSVTVVGDAAVLTAIVVDVVDREGQRETFRLGQRTGAFSLGMGQRARGELEYASVARPETIEPEEPVA
jgi:Domain of unknown function (DUF4440)